MHEQRIDVLLALLAVFLLIVVIFFGEQFDPGMMIIKVCAAAQ